MVVVGSDLFVSRNCWCLDSIPKVTARDNKGICGSLRILCVHEVLMHYSGVVASEPSFIGKINCYHLLAILIYFSSWERIRMFLRRF
jgi:hypothetical protein